MDKFEVHIIAKKKTGLEQLFKINNYEVHELVLDGQK